MPAIYIIYVRFGRFTMSILKCHGISVLGIGEHAPAMRSMPQGILPRLESPGIVRFQPSWTYYPLVN